MSAFNVRRKAQKDALAESKKNGNKSRSGILQFMQTNYSSLPIKIPDSFLTANNSSAVTYSKIDWASSPLPEYQDSYAVVLDNVLSQAECDEFIALAEASAGSGNKGVVNKGWRAALVNAGGNTEFLATEYRNSDRIIWDQKEVVRRIWERCLLAPGLEEDLAMLEGNKKILNEERILAGEKWRFTRLNERMRFLRYGEGQFFKEHCDGCYETPDRAERSWYTLHLYLNDSKQGLESVNGVEKSKEDSPKIGDENEDGGDKMLRGGATTFHSYHGKKPMDVDPKAGRVLIFQHRGLLHSGDTVLEGVKYTLRTDLMYARESPVRVSVKPQLGN